MVDKSGHEVPTVERGELDQEQHDAVQDVFCIPGAATLVRADLFASLGGFDPAITLPRRGPRPLLAGAGRRRPGARRAARPWPATSRRSASAGASGPRSGAASALRHRLRAVLTCYGRFHRLRVVPQVALLAVAEVVYAARRRPAPARRPTSPAPGGGTGGTARTTSPPAAGSRPIRAVPDSEVRRLQARGSARFAAFLRGQLGRSGDDRVRALGRSGRELAGSLRTSARSTTVVVWAVLLAVLVIGLAPLPLRRRCPRSSTSRSSRPRPWPLLAEWLSGWRPRRSRERGAAADRVRAARLLGTLLVGSTALLTGCSCSSRCCSARSAPPGSPAAPDRPGGRWRPPWSTPPSRCPTTPSPPAAGAGSSPGRPCPGSSPPLARAGDDPPFDRDPTRAWWRDVVRPRPAHRARAAVVPDRRLAPLVLAVVLVIGGARRGAARRRRPDARPRPPPPPRRRRPAPAVVPRGAPARRRLGVLRRGRRRPSRRRRSPSCCASSSGPIGAAPVGYAFARRRPAPAPDRPFVAGHAGRCGRGRSPSPGGASPSSPAPTGSRWRSVRRSCCSPRRRAASPSPSPSGMVSFEIDVPGHRFGWRQVVGFAAAAAVAVGCVPVRGRIAVGGRWEAPTRGVSDVLGFLDAEQADGRRSGRCGSATRRVLPLGGWELDEGVAWATTDEGLPTVVDRWPGSPDGRHSPGHRRPRPRPRRPDEPARSAAGADGHPLRRHRPGRPPRRRPRGAGAGPSVPAPSASSSTWPRSRSTPASASSATSPGSRLGPRSTTSAAEAAAEPLDPGVGRRSHRGRPVLVEVDGVDRYTGPIDDDAVGVVVGGVVVGLAARDGRRRGRARRRASAGGTSTSSAGGGDATLSYQTPAQPARWCPASRPPPGSSPPGRCSSPAAGNVPRAPDDDPGSPAPHRRPARDAARPAAAGAGAPTERAVERRPPHRAGESPDAPGRRARRRRGSASAGSSSPGSRSTVAATTDGVDRERSATTTTVPEPADLSPVAPGRRPRPARRGTAPAGTATSGGFADHSVTIANPGDERRVAVEVTVFGGTDDPAADVPGPTTQSVEVPAAGEHVRPCRRPRRCSLRCRARRGRRRRDRRRALGVGRRRVRRRAVRLGTVGDLVRRRRRHVTRTPASCSTCSTRSPTTSSSTSPSRRPKGCGHRRSSTGSSSPASASSPSTSGPWCRATRRCRPRSSPGRAGSSSSASRPSTGPTAANPAGLALTPAAPGSGAGVEPARRRLRRRRPRGRHRVQPVATRRPRSTSR